MAICSRGRWASHEYWAIPMTSLEQSHPKARRKLSGCRILLIEDEYFLADDLASELRAEGAEIVGPVDDVDEALRELDRNHLVHGAILDINLRNNMIYPVADALRRRKIPFVFTTGYAKLQIPDAYKDVPVWEKPLDIPGLIQSLRALLTALRRGGKN